MIVNAGSDISPAGMVQQLYSLAAGLDNFGMGVMRFALVLVLLWIGGIKFADYEADGIVPLVANSPLMSFFYRYPPPEYRAY